MRTTHTYAILEVAPATFDDIKQRLLDAGGSSSRAAYEREYLDRDAEFGEILCIGPIGFARERISPVGAPPLVRQPEPEIDTAVIVKQMAFVAIAIASLLLVAAIIEAVTAARGGS